MAHDRTLDPHARARAAGPAPEDLAHALRAIARTSRLLERASGELNLAQYRVLAAVSSGAERSSRVAARLAVGKPTVSSLVDTLHRRGLIARGEVQGDQRVAALRLTSAGEAALAEAEAAMAERLMEVCGRTPDPCRVVQALVWLEAAVDELMAERQGEGRR